MKQLIVAGLLIISAIASGAEKESHCVTEQRYIKDFGTISAEYFPVNEPVSVDGEVRIFVVCKKKPNPAARTPRPRLLQKFQTGVWNDYRVDEDRKIISLKLTGNVVNRFSGESEPGSPEWVHYDFSNACLPSRPK